MAKDAGTPTSRGWRPERKENYMATPMRVPIPDPMNDPELRPLAVLTLTARGPGLGDEEELTGAAVPEMGQHIDRLSPSQLHLLKAALVHALGPGHQGEVDFRTRTTGYQLDGIGLELIDGTGAGQVLPLVVVFVYPEASQSPSSGG